MLYAIACLPVALYLLPVTGVKGFPVTEGLQAVLQVTGQYMIFFSGLRGISGLIVKVKWWLGKGTGKFVIANITVSFQTFEK